MPPGLGYVYILTKIIKDPRNDVMIDFHRRTVDTTIYCGAGLAFSLSTGVVSNRIRGFKAMQQPPVRYIRISNLGQKQPKTLTTNRLYNITN